MMRTGLILLLCWGLLSACVGGTSPQTHYYSLLPLSEGQNTSRTSGSDSEMSLGIGPLSFPDYLKRPQIVTREGEHQLILNEFQRWGAPLEKEFSAALADNLRTILHIDRVVMFPWAQFFEPTFRVVMDVDQFEGRLGGDVVLKAHWAVVNGAGKEILAVRQSSIVQAVAAPDWESLVAAQSLATKALAEEISREIQVLSPRP